LWFAQHSDDYSLSEPSSLLRKPFERAHTEIDNSNNDNNTQGQEQTPEQQNDGGPLNGLPQSTVEVLPEAKVEEPGLPETPAPENDIPPPKDGTPEFPLPGDVQELGQNLNNEEQGFKPDFLFQEDLKLDLPISTLKAYSSHKPHNYGPNTPNAPKINAYSTFMATRNPSIKDPYYMVIHSLIYRVLWSARSRTERHPFIVFVGNFVTVEQRELLSGAGAIVRELAPLEWECDAPGWQARWKDLFAKLNMWKETEFSRILFLDAECFPRGPN
jgi:hypothetical protein